MASRELVILSSSPTRLADDFPTTPPTNAAQRTHYSTALLRSPPSPSEIFKRVDTRLKTGSRTVEAPKGVNLGFVTAGLFVQENGLNGCNENTTKKKQGKYRGTGKGKERAPQDLPNYTKVSAISEASKPQQKILDRHCQDFLGDVPAIDSPLQGTAREIPEPRPSSSTVRRKGKETLSVQKGVEIVLSNLEYRNNPGLPSIAKEVPVDTKEELKLVSKSRRLIGEILRFPKDQPQTAASKLQPVQKISKVQRKRFLSSTYVKDSDSDSEAPSICPDRDNATVEDSRQPKVQDHTLPTEIVSKARSLRDDLPDFPLLNPVKVKKTRVRRQSAKPKSTSVKRKSTQTKPALSNKPAGVSDLKKGVQTKKTKSVSKHFKDFPEDPNSALDGIPGQQILDLTEQPRGDLLDKAQEDNHLFINLDNEDQRPVLPLETSSPCIAMQNDLAPKRRLSWTPKKDSAFTHLHTNPTASAVAQHTSDLVEKTSFKALLLNFSYQNDDSSLSTGIPKGGAGRPQKKRRIELLAPRLPRSAAKVKTKSAKKKVTTITGLATEKYSNSKTEATATALDLLTADAAPADSRKAGDLTSKIKPPKRRASTSASVASKSTPKANGKLKKKSKLNPSELLPPNKAMSHIQKQDVLFGTLSQLVQEETPHFIRDLQGAIRASEEDPVHKQLSCLNSQRNAGRSLAMARTKSSKQGLWSIGHRDSEGGFLKPTQQIRADTAELNVVLAENASTSSHVHIPHTEAIIRTKDKTADVKHCSGPMETTPKDTRTRTREQLASPDVHGQVIGPTGSLTGPSIPIDTTTEDEVKSGSQEFRLFVAAMTPDGQNEPSNTDSSYGRYCSQEHVPLCEDSTSGRCKHRNELNSTSGLQSAQTNTTVAPNCGEESEFMDIDKLIKSPTPLKMDSSFVDIDELLSLHPISSIPSSPPRELHVTPPRRKALLPIPSYSNIPSPKFQASKPFSTLSKASALSSAAEVVKRPRGRPRKGSKVLGHVEAQAAATEARKKQIRAQHPKKRKTQDIDDEISDSEVECTPSPPRQHLSPSQSLELTTEPNHAATIEAEDEKSDWSVIKPNLFATIIKTIREEPRTKDTSKPTWHEKILLYDPIVLEDLTEWLNGKGLRLPKNSAVKPPKGSKRIERLDGEADVLLLQPWMVQKWCEESSICCLWKDGLRGGVRNNY